MGRNEGTNSVRDGLRDGFANFLASLPNPLPQIIFQRFRRPALWWLFRAYGAEFALAPAGPRGNRFRMWLSPAAYSDFVFGTYESICAQKLAENVKQGAICVDVGANLGYFSILMSRLVGETGQVIAFEPMPDTFEILCKNVSLNQLTNTKTVRGAVSNESASVQLFTEPSVALSKTASMIAYRLEGARQATQVPALRLDDYFAGEKRLPDLIKMDVEGAEGAVLKGARETITRGQPLLMVEIHAWGSPESQQILDLLAEFEYEVDILEIRGHEALCLAKPRQKGA
jgi:FkbM family methyltransferase